MKNYQVLPKTQPKAANPSFLREALFTLQGVFDGPSDQSKAVTLLNCFNKYQEQSGIKRESQVKHEKVN